jgi:hypothetical protein
LRETSLIRGGTPHLGVSLFFSPPPFNVQLNNARLCHAYFGSESMRIPVITISLGFDTIAAVYRFDNRIVHLG